MVEGCPHLARNQTDILLPEISGCLSPVYGTGAHFCTNGKHEWLLEALCWTSFRVGWRWPSFPFPCPRQSFSVLSQCTKGAGMFLPPHWCLWAPNCPFLLSSCWGCCWLMHVGRHHWAAWTSGGAHGSCCVATHVEDCHGLLQMHRSLPELRATCLHRLLHLQECLQGLLLPNCIALCFLGLSYDIEFALLIWF